MDHRTQTLGLKGQVGPLQSHYNYIADTGVFCNAGNTVETPPRKFNIDKNTKEERIENKKSYNTMNQQLER